MMGWYGGGMGIVSWLFMGAFWLALLALIVWLVVRLLPSAQRPAPGLNPQSPEEILDERFARGEIDADEYRARQEVLRGTDR